MFLRTVFAATAAMTIAGCAASAQNQAALEGTVSYHERMALPPSATVDVRIVEISRADAPAVTIAEQQIVPKGLVPVGFRLLYDPAKINPNNRYALQAEIRDEGELLFTTTTMHPILTGGHDNTDIVVERVN